MSVFWLHFGAKLVPKGGRLGDPKKVEKSETNGPWDLFGFELPSGIDFGWILDGFWMDLG